MKFNYKSSFQTYENESVEQLFSRTMTPATRVRPSAPHCMNLIKDSNKERYTPWERGCPFFHSKHSQMGLINGGKNVWNKEKKIYDFPLFWTDKIPRFFQEVFRYFKANFHLLLKQKYNHIQKRIILQVGTDDTTYSLLDWRYTRRKPLFFTFHLKSLNFNFLKQSFCKPYYEGKIF